MFHSWADMSSVERVQLWHAWKQHPCTALLMAAIEREIATTTERMVERYPLSPDRLPVQNLDAGRMDGMTMFQGYADEQISAISKEGADV